MSKNQESNREKNLAYYCQRFSELKTNKDKKLGTAKHKPILLLSVIDLISEGLIQNNQITVSEELINTFNKNWKILYSGSYKSGLYYPFYHLQNDGFWNVKFNSDFVNTLPVKKNYKRTPTRITKET
ncbi:hypothetical protein [Okeania sp.]|uniref:hypothetical protein n=1 Tax=Okeania sp. TaxID=3100323 RepID=UPI002B4B02E6|nr:hypothetical protein [Okeania sp.]MEB3343679.1 hypothetical protein [Okeania sp.]